MSETSSALLDALKIRFPTASNFEISDVVLVGPEKVDLVSADCVETVMRLRVDAGDWFDYREDGRLLFDLFGDAIAPSVKAIPDYLAKSRKDVLRLWACSCCCAVLRGDELPPCRCQRCGDEVKLLSQSFAEAVEEIEMADTPLPRSF